MKAVLKLFWHICLMRESPERVPTYPWFVATVVVANILVSIALGIALGADPWIATATGIIVSQAAMAVLVWLACMLREVPQRFTATITAIFGCDLIVTSAFALTQPLSELVNPTLNAYTYLGYALWSIWIVGFILQRSLNAHLAVSILIAFGIVLLSTSVGQMALSL